MLHIYLLLSQFVKYLKNLTTTGRQIRVIIVLYDSSLHCQYVMIGFIIWSLTI